MSEMFLKYIKKLYTRLSGTIDNNEDQEIKEYLLEIVDPKFHLIDMSIDLLKDPNTDIEYIRQNYFILKQFLIYIYFDVVDRYRDDKTFTYLLVKYLENYNKEIYGQNFIDPFFIFVKIFKCYYFKNLISEQLIYQLFTIIDEVNDKDFLNNIFYVLMQMCLSKEELNDDKTVENYFLNIYSSHKNSRIFNEIGLRLLIENCKNIEPSNEKMYGNSIVKGIIKCFTYILEREKKCVFYTTDLQVLIDLFIFFLQYIYKEGSKIRLFDFIEKIINFDVFYKLNYRIDELKFTLKTYVDYKFESEERKSQAQVILNNIEEHLSKIDEEKNKYHHETNKSIIENKSEENYDDSFSSS